MSLTKTPAELLGEGWIHGIDVSDHQDPARIDWGKMREAGTANGGTGIQFAWVKLSEGQTFVAKHSKTHTLGAHLSGMLVSGYHYARPDTDVGPADPIREAQNFVGELYAIGETVVNGLPPVLDYEEEHTNHTQWIEDFCGEVERRTGIEPWVYTSKMTYRKYIPAKYKQWIAAYSASQPVDDLVQWQCWQYTGMGVVPGYHRAIDLNVMSPEAWKQLQRNT